MTLALRDRALARLCNVLDAVPATAPTQCEGWDAHALAVHIWQLKHDPPAWPGEIVPRLAGVSRRRAEAVRRRWDYPELVLRLRRGPGSIACMPGDFREGHRHALGEYFIHTQDVARPNSVEQPVPDAALEEALWLRALRAAPYLHRHKTPGLVLRRLDGTTATVTTGAGHTVVTGPPSELLCWVYGRPAGVCVDG